MLLCRALLGSETCKASRPRAVHAASCKTSMFPAIARAPCHSISRAPCVPRRLQYLALQLLGISAFSPQSLACRSLVRAKLQITPKGRFASFVCSFVWGAVNDTETQASRCTGHDWASLTFPLLSTRFSILDPTLLFPPYTLLVPEHWLLVRGTP